MNLLLNYITLVLYHIYLFSDSGHLEELCDSMLLEEVGVASQLQVVQPALNTREQRLGRENIN